MAPINANDVRRLREQIEREERIAQDHESRLAMLKTEYERAHLDIERRTRDLERKAADIKQMEKEIAPLRAAAVRDKHELSEIQKELAQSELQRRKPTPGRGTRTL